MTKIYRPKKQHPSGLKVPSQTSCSKKGLDVNKVIGYPQSQTNRDFYIYVKDEGSGVVIEDDYVFYGITGDELNNRHPELKPGDIVISKSNGMKFLKLTNEEWTPQIIEVI